MNLVIRNKRMNMNIPIDEAVLVQLQELPDNDYSTPQKKGDRRAGKKERISWTDRMFLQFMKGWWKHSPKPFFYEHKGRPGESGAMRILEKMR